MIDWIPPRHEAPDAGRGDATRSCQTVLDVLVSWMTTAGFLPHQKRVAHYPQEYFEVRRLPVLRNVVSAAVTLHHLGLQPATATTHSVGVCEWLTTRV